MERASGRPTAKYVEVNHPWFSNAGMPVYRWTFPTEATDEELNASLEAREDFAVRARHSNAWVVDLSNVTKAPAKQRAALAKHLERFGELNSPWYLGSAVIVPNAWLRGIVTAVTWRWPPRFPYELFPSSIEAERWARKQVAEKPAGLLRTT